MPRDPSRLTWWLMKKAIRRYVRESVKGTPLEHKWRSIYVGLNFGAPNGLDEAHLAYLDRYEQKELR
jgi:hypothetical protein